MADETETPGQLLKRISAVPPATPVQTPATAPAEALQGNVFSVPGTALPVPELSIKALCELLDGMGRNGHDLAAQLTLRTGHLLNEPLPQAVKHDELTDGSDMSRLLRYAIRRQARLNDILTHLLTHLEA
jgi:hypothetical protein